MRDMLPFPSMTAFLIVLESWGGANVTEISYERRAKEMLTGVKKVRDVIGHSYYLSERVRTGSTADTLSAALAKAESHALGHLRKMETLLAEIAAIAEKEQ